MDSNSILLLERYRKGDSAAADALFDRFVKRLIALARKRMSAKLATRVDAEDVVQSVYRSFFVRARDGEFELSETGDMWRLLAAITVNKVRKQAEFHRRQKRDMQREVPAGGVDDSVHRLSKLLAVDPGEPEAVAVSDELETLMALLPDRDRLILELTLNGVDVGIIAERIGRTEYIVNRCLGDLRKRLEERLRALDQ